MYEKIKNTLIQEGYSLHSAEVTANDLIMIKDAEIAKALNKWVDSREITDISRGVFSCCHLMSELNMKYPATLIFLDWYCEDPESALASIRYGGG